MTAKTHPYVIETYPTQSAAWLASARVAFNTGAATEVRTAVEIVGTERRTCYVLAAVTESGAFAASQLLEEFPR